MREVIAYKCNCGKIFTTKSNCKRHEKTCLKNHSNQSCFTCAYFDRTEKSCFQPIPGQREIAFQKDKLTIYRDCDTWDNEVN